MQLLVGLLTLNRRQAVAEPFPAQLLQHGALPDALRPGQDDHVVELAAGAEHPGHRSDQVLPCHRPHVLRVFGTQVIYPQGFCPLLPVPFLAFDIIPYRVEMLLHEHFRTGVPDQVCALYAVNGAEIVAQAGIVRILPYPALALGPPRQVLQQHGAEAEVIIGDPACQVRVLFQDQFDVLGRGLYIALLIPVQLLHPGRVKVCIDETVIEGVPDHLDPFPVQFFPHGAVCRCQLAHGLIAGQVVDRRVGTDFLVLFPELVDPDQVKGIDQLPADRVCPVMAERELPVLIQHQPRGRTALGIGEPVRFPCLRVRFRQECFDCFPDRITPAERAYQPRLGQRVALLFCRTEDDIVLPAGYRPGAGVMPVIV